MPTYHFVCDVCGKAFEQQLPMGSAVPPCPHCRGISVRKIIKAPMVHFKGSGFYKTDSGGGLKQAPAESKPSTETPETKPAEKKSETPKPETPKKSDSAAKQS